MDSNNSGNKSLTHADPRSVDELVAVALRGNLNEREQALWALRYRATREVFETARKLSGDTDPHAKRLGVCILSQLGVPDRVYADESTAILLQLIEQGEKDESLLEAICYGFGHLRATAGIEQLARLKNHQSSQIRVAVVNGLMCQTNQLAIKTLVEMTADTDAAVRNWATFALGSMVDINAPSVNDALLHRLEDPVDDIGEEALLGLARRRDGRILSHLQKKLSSNSVSDHSVEAAKELGDQSLLPLLRSLKLWWTLRPNLLDEAITSCSVNDARENK